MWRRWRSWSVDELKDVCLRSNIEKLLRVQTVDLLFLGLRNIQFLHLLQGHRIELIVAPAAAMRIIGAEENLIGTHRVVDELDERGANRPGGVVINLFEVNLRLLLANGIALAPVEAVEIEQDHAAEMGCDQLQFRI